MKQQITERQKAIIDRWQEKYPKDFPKKPAPKVYLDSEKRANYIGVAMIDWEESPEDAIAAMLYWRKGKRWREATLRVIQEDIFRNLRKHFPKLFNPQDQEPPLLKIGIDKDLVAWGRKYGYNRKMIRAVLNKWVTRDSYQSVLENAMKHGGVRYGLDLKEHRI